jgi:predicted DNA-binding WGR domain protein
MVKLLLNKDYSPKEKINEISNIRSTRTRRKFFLGATTPAVLTDESSNDVSTSDEFVVTSSIDLNASDSLGRTCIHHLVQPFPDGSYTSNIELLRLLHKSGASLTKHDLAGLSPLQYGAINGCQHLCDELTKLSNDPTNSTLATIEHFYINDPNKNLLDSSPDFYLDAQLFIDKYISTHPSHTENTAYQVDHLSGMSLTGEVLIDNEKNEPYDVRLIKIDVSYGVYGFYNFYRMQIIKHKSKNNLYFLFTRWGRIGDDGQHQLTPYSTLDECRKEFLKVFREKTGNAWKDTNQFESKIKKYTLIKLSEREMQKYPNVEIDFNRLQSEEQHPSSKLQSIVYKNFLKTLINRQAIRTNLNKTQLDIEWMPVSQLKRETLQKARDILIKLKKIFERKQELKLEILKAKTIENQNEMKTILESIYEYTNQYYTLIPLKGYSEQKLPIFNDEELLKNQEKILDDLLELELAYKILLGAQANLKTISPLDYLYKSMKCQFEAMNKDDIDSQLILRYIWASSSNIQVEQIFKIARPNEDNRLFKSNLDNHYLLWHGTSICNLISILTRGNFIMKYIFFQCFSFSIKVFLLDLWLQKQLEVYLER